MMPIIVPGTHGHTSVARSNACEAEIVEHVQRLLTSAQPDRRVQERRRSRRHPFPHPVQLTPVDGDGAMLIEEAIEGMGKHLSAHGLDFYHRVLLPHRQVIVSLDHAGGTFSMLMQLTWCRFNRHGWYDSGGKFLRVVPLQGE